MSLWGLDRAPLGAVRWWVGSVAPGGYAANSWAPHPVPTLAMRSLVHCGYRGQGDGHELWSDGVFHAHDPGSVVPVCPASYPAPPALTVS